MTLVWKPCAHRRFRWTRALQSNASTVNPSEISHFSRLSSLWWDEQGEFKFLHRMNPVRMQFVREKLQEVARDEQREEERVNLLNRLDVLDVGCGGGLMCEVSSS
jgi:2-polyprenyl-6-hydroxyphenyl methylase/3-demethylubiquinone-9 3-methyltransferase